MKNIIKKVAYELKDGEISCVEPSLYVIDFAMSKGIHKIMNYMYVRDEYRLQLM